jgi:hypothetical protein
MKMRGILPHAACSMRAYLLSDRLRALHLRLLIYGCFFFWHYRWWIIGFLLLSTDTQENAVNEVNAINVKYPIRVNSPACDE